MSRKEDYENKRILKGTEKGRKQNWKGKWTTYIRWKTETFKGSVLPSYFEDEYRNPKGDWMREAALRMEMYHLPQIEHKDFPPGTYHKEWLIYLYGD